MKHLFNKLSAFLVMLMCMSATVQAEIVHHTVCDPTATSRGFNVECWENTVTNKFYTNEACTQELTGAELAKNIVYAKLPSNPISGNSEFDVVEFDNTQTWGVNLNWAAETTFSNAYSAWSSTPRYAEFTVACDNVEDARLVWIKNQQDVVNGRYSIKIYVKDVETQVSTEVYSYTQTDIFEGVTIQNLKGLKKGDIVKFEVTQIAAATWHEAAPTFKACLEYTSSRIIHHTPCEPTLSTRGFNRECWENTETGKIYSDANCTQELVDEALAKAVIYAKLPVSPFYKSYNEFSRSDHTESDWGVDLNWAAVANLYYIHYWWELSNCYAIFKVNEENVTNARLVWNRNQKSFVNGKYQIQIFVNDVEVFSKKNDEEYEGVFVNNLPGLKRGDEVKFAVTQYDVSTLKEEAGNFVTFKAALEYELHQHNFVDNVCTHCGLIHHEVVEPTPFNKRGFTRECWEMQGTDVKYFADEQCREELVDEALAKAVIYSTLPKSPIKSLENFEESDHVENDWGVDLNWAAVTTYYNAWKEASPEPRTATFQVANVIPSYARLVWNRNQMATYNGKYTVQILVNDVEVFSRNQNNNEEYEGVFVQSLPKLKAGDEIKFVVTQNQSAKTYEYDAQPTFKACLEYLFECNHSYPQGSAICSHCGYIKPHDHEYEGHECKLCNAVEPGFLVDYVGKDADRKNIKWVLDIDAHTLTFTGSGEMENVVPRHCGWKDDTLNGNVTKVIIEEGITSIGDCEGFHNGYFFNMSGLQDVSLPSTLETIGTSAFCQCVGLKEITLPQGLLTIANGAFEYVALEEVDIPASVTSIGTYAFSTTETLKKITLNGSPYLNTYAFAACWELTDFYLMSNSHVDAQYNDVFNNIDISKSTLHVNNEIIDWARSTSPWNEFGKVKPLDNISIVDDDDVLHTINFNPEATDNTWTLTDGGKKIAIYEDIPMQKLVYTRNFERANQWNALYVPFEMSYNDWAGKFDVAAITNFHEYTDENGETEKIELEVRYVKNGKLRANTPYLIRAKAAGEQTIVLNGVTLQTTVSKSIDCRSTEREYTFTGTYDAIDGLQTKDYIFVSGGRLCKAGNDTDVLKPMRWYLTITERGSMTINPSPALAKPISIHVIGEDDTTGIEEITVVSSSLNAKASGIYSISGVKLAKPQQGINIINGKKVNVR